ncbi:MAG: hypothetical protein KY469_10040 [Actinobacteria bacterium]|nr:hypothetical protein [Actinomycetota bacterium]
MGTLLAVALLSIAAGTAPVQQADIELAIVDHDAVFYDQGRTRPALFAYSSRARATAGLPVEVTADTATPAARLEREALSPTLRPDATLGWAFAGRGAPVKVNAEDTLPVHVIVDARANPYGTRWWHRQETATDLWAWGGVLAGGLLSGEEHADNAVFGLGPTTVAYPERSIVASGEAQLAWDDRHLIRTATTVDHDPATGRTFEGVFWGNLAQPALRIVGGDGVFEQDTAAPPLVLELPVRPSGLVFFSTPPAPPGVEVSWTRALDFNARTLTLQATVHAGSVWPASGALDDDPTVPTWEWSPWVFFMGWDYGDLVNGGPGEPAALEHLAAPARLRPDGSLAVDRLAADGSPLLPPGLLDANLPPGAHVELAATGQGGNVGGRRIPGPALPAATERTVSDEGGGQVVADGASVDVVDRDGTPALAIARDGVEVGELAVPALTVDGASAALDDAVLLDRWVNGPAQPGSGRWSVVALYDTGEVFADVVLLVDALPTSTSATWYLWDGHSTDGSPHDVTVHTVFDPAIGGDDGDAFREPFYTGETYAEEAAVPQGVLDFPVGALLHGWFGSLPAVQAFDTAGGPTVTHLQLSPNVGGPGRAEALHTTAYLLADHASYEPDPDAAVADAEPIEGTDVLLQVTNHWSGTIWEPNFIPYFSMFLVG